ETGPESARRYRATTTRGAAGEWALDDAGDAAGVLAAADAPASGRAMAREQAEAFRAALGRLPDDYRQVILLRYQQELSFEEIGRHLERSPNAARMLWLRALERLKQEMGMTT